MRFTLLTFFVSSLISVLGQNPIKVSISGTIFNATTDSIRLSQNFGTHYLDHAKIPLSKKGEFSITTTLPNPDYYVMRIGASNVNLILRNGSDIKLYGDGKDLFAHCNIVGSEESDKMNNFIKIMSVWFHKRDSAVALIQQNPSRQEEISNSVMTDYYNFQSNMQSFVAQNQNSAALVPVISAIDTEKDFATYESLIAQLNVGFPDSPTIKQLTLNYQQAKAKKEAANLVAPGKLAPDFEELKLDGVAKMKLSDLRGKIVLLDFWASWCGPCRKENPNVVRLYDKYEKSGFTVMSVSLDKDRAAWKAAIEKDNLKWPNHVSDLQQWSSKAGQLYQVKGIPFTVLIDKEGKIIKTNLRGEALEAELKQIFGF
jgi:peroxiredoxin